ncbi:N-acetyltransferase family protein [Roseospira marina]|uniref:N-acetyltransferase family protein n=1 Tax=Roseospira marina TaxID=140057 RepID=A0A5M6IGC5_9PROT|nr:GNAT family N-acetyltransferase [Roseospira marina]KAA5607360.1 N-acetyltransferase family protein [Roseospira marina]MBB4312472.1 phosphinothricin acetyltransferase [Roseospira marina]MBB5085512.1 phosphinothricin acetyltransferase [Roseospira marina]
MSDRSAVREDAARWSITDAAVEDAAAVQAIYAHHVRTGTATFELEPPTCAAMTDRMAAVQAAGLPWLVARESGNGRVLGYAYAGPFRARPAYRLTVEDSVYLDPSAAGLGLGAALLNAVIDRCGARDVRQMIAVITTPGGEASVALHRKLGFELIGELPAVGRKFGRWLGTIYMQRAIGSGAATAPLDEGRAADTPAESANPDGGQGT